MSLYLNWSVQFHGAVVIGGNENHQFGEVDHVRAVVLEGVFEGEIRHVEKDEGQGESQDEQRDFGVVVLKGYVETESHPIQYLDCDVRSANAVIFELQFELSVELLLRVLEIEETDNYCNQGGVEDNHAENAQRIVQ